MRRRPGSGGDRGGVFGQQRRGTPVQQPVGLTVSHHRHGGFGGLGGDVANFDAEFCPGFSGLCGFPGLSGLCGCGFPNISHCRFRVHAFLVTLLNMSDLRLLVLDGHSLAFRAFYSRPPENFRTTTGVYTNAVHGFMSMLLAMLRREKPTHIGAAFDLSRHSFRTDIYPDYKGGRAETPPEFLGQIENIQRLLDALGIKWLTMENVEADDILATLATQGKAQGMQVLVSSGDRDTFQLIDESTTVLYPGHNAAQTTRMTPQAVKDKYGVWPAQYPEVAALVGEKADNLPGVPLVGEKSAAAWINQYGGLEGILAHRGELKGKRGENLRAHVDDVLRNRELNRLRTDLHLPLQLDDLRWRGMDVSAVDAVCAELEFKEMRRQFLAFFGVSGGASGSMPGFASPGFSGGVGVDSVDTGAVDMSASRGASRDSLAEPQPEASLDFGSRHGFGIEPHPVIHRLESDFQAGELREWLGLGQAPHESEIAVWAVGNIGVNAPSIDWLFLAKHVAIPEGTTGETAAKSPTNPSGVASGDREANPREVTGELTAKPGNGASGGGTAASLALFREEAVLVTPSTLRPESENVLRDFFAAENRTVVVYNAKALRHALRAYGWELSGTVRDVNLLDYLADPDASRLKFAAVTERLLGWSIDEKPSDIGKISEQMAFDLGWGNVTDAAGAAAVAASTGSKDISGGIPLPSLPETLVNQAKYALSLLDMLPILTEQVEYRRVGSLLDMELPLSRLLERMEDTGIAVDEGLLQRFDQELSSEVKRTEAAAFEAIGREVNLSSPKQLQDVLFNQLGLPPTRKTKTGYTTDAKALEELALYNPHPFLQALLYFRDRSKLLQVVRNLGDRIASDGRIHTTFGQTVAATGRLSSLDPNLQNIPARTDDGARIRETFIAQMPFVSLMTADYSQIEMRIMAHLSGDEGLIAAFKSGEDLHRSVAALVFGVAPEAVTATQRTHVKATSYGLAYGLSAFGLAGQLRISQGEAKHLMETYFSRFGAVRDYLEHIVSEARRVGYTETMWGRRRYLPGLRATNRVVAENARRAALNAPIQGSAADLMKQAMLRVDAAMAAAGLGSRILLQIHDELVFEVAPGEVDALRRVVTEAMTSVVELRVPLEVSVGVGANWRAAAH